MTQTEVPQLPAGGRRSRKGRSGQTMIEFVFIMPLMFMLVFMQLDIAFAVYAQATLLQAVRQGVRYGVTNQTCGSGTAVSTCVQQTVVAAANGLLSGAFGNTSSEVSSTCWGYNPSSGNLEVVSTSWTPVACNAGGNVLEVKVTGYNLPLLLPMFSYINGTSMIGSVDNRSMSFTVSAADRFEPITTPPTW
jgi:Flp pilus assembly protein TadG